MKKSIFLVITFLVNSLAFGSWRGVSKDQASSYIAKKNCDFAYFYTYDGNVYIDKKDHKPNNIQVGQSFMCFQSKTLGKGAVQQKVCRVLPIDIDTGKYQKMQVRNLRGSFCSLKQYQEYFKVLDKKKAKSSCQYSELCNLAKNIKSYNYEIHVVTDNHSFKSKFFELIEAMKKNL